MSVPLLHVLAGPNGAGRSTLALEVLRPATGLPFVDADEIGARRWPGATAEHAYEAAREAAGERRRLMALRASFITETVFSHPSKVDLVADAVALGYPVQLHVVLVPVSLPVERVRARVEHGGHDVPDEKVLERYERLWPLVARARDLADRTTCYNNSRAARPFRGVARYARGRVVGEPTWPTWTPGALLD